MSMSQSKWATNSILVCRIPPNGPKVKKCLKTYFEDNSASGGGPICPDGVCVTDSEREAIIQFVHEKDAVIVRKKKSHRLNFGGEVADLEVLRCPATVFSKYMTEYNSSVSDERCDSHSKYIHKKDGSLTNKQTSSTVNNANCDAVVKESDERCDSHSKYIHKKGESTTNKQTTNNNANRDPFVKEVVKPKVLSKSIDNRDTKENRNWTQVRGKQRTTENIYHKVSDLQRTVIVEGSTPKVCIDVVEMFFENKKKSGGGPIETINYQENSGFAELVFEDPASAERVTSVGKHDVAGDILYVKPAKPPETHSDIPIQDQEENEDKVIIKVSGISPDMSEEMLLLFFESKRKSGGGEVDSLQMDETTGTANLVYKHNEDAERVLSRKVVRFNGKEMTVEKLEMSIWDGRSVCVTGGDQLKEEVLELMYENKKKSGGGPVQSVVISQDKKTALITFENKEDAAQVLHQAIVKTRDGIVYKATKPLDDHTVTGAAVAPVEEIVVSSSITVLGLDESVNEELLEMLFENESKSGGGTVESVSIDNDFGIAVITFEDYKVAERVLAKESIAFKGMNLILQPHMESPKEPMGAYGGAAAHERQKLSPRKESKFNCIEVSGLKAGTAKDFILLFFESRKAGGGDVDTITYNEEEGCAVITFKDEETTKSVLQKHSDRPLSINGAQISIRPIDTSAFGGHLPGITSCAIEVTGLPVNATVETLEMFFENRRMSGGENMEEIVHIQNEGKAVITYSQSEVAQRVVDKHKGKPLKFEECQLNIKLLCSKSRPSQVAGLKEANTLFLKNLPENVDAEDIRVYLERVGQCKVQDCVFGTTAGTVLVNFIFMPGYEKFYELSCQRPLKGNMVDVETVQRSKSIEVYGAEGESKQMIILYFEHSKSDGGEVEHVQILDGCAIVTFKKYGVAEKVLTHLGHTLNKKPLTIGLHHECLGVLPPHHDCKSPSAGIPSHLTIDKFDSDIIEFILTTPQNRKFADERMNKVSAQIVWPQDPSAEREIQVNCVLKRSAKNLQKKVMNWTGNTKQTFDDLMMRFMVSKIDTLKDAWPDFVKKCAELKPKDREEANVMVDDSNCSVFIVGKKAVVEQTFSHLIQVKDQIEQRLMRLAQVTKEPVTNLKPFQVIFLRAHKFSDHIKQTFKDMTIDLDVKQSKVIFTGITADIIAAKLQMYELVNEMVSDKMQISQNVATLLRHKKLKDQIIQKFKEAHIIAVYDVGAKEVTLYSKSQHEVDTGLALVRDSFIEKTVDIKEDSKHTLKTNKWKEMKDTMLKDYDGELKIHIMEDCSQINLTASGRVANGVLEMIDMHLKENTILKHFINMDSGTMKLMNKCQTTELDKIEREFNMAAVHIHCSRSPEKPGFQVEGTEGGLFKAIKEIQSLAKGIVYMDHQIDKPGMPKCFYEERGRSYLDSLETTYKVAIELDKDRQLKRSSSDGASGGGVNHTKIRFQVPLGSGKTLLLAEGDLPTYKVDAIVNAANAELKHYGGLAKAIVDKGGNIIQVECDRYIAQRSSLLTGQVFVSGPGKLPCKKIIHAVGPKWRGGYGNEINELYEAVYQTLETATAERLTTIAVPAISSGVFGFPIARSCETIVAAIKDYFKDEQTTLREVHLVDNVKRTVNTFYESLVQTFGKGDVMNMDDRGFGAVPKPSRFSHSSYTSPSQVTTSSTPSYWKTVGTDCLKTTEGITVTLVRGAITSQPVDVIVNSTRTDLNLGSGGVSASILAAAGNTIQIQCKQSAPGGVTHGEIVVTNGGNIGCASIYHGACPHYQDASSVKILQKFIANCLNNADANGMTSIAFPAIGTGNLGFPRPVVAMEMFEEVKKFSQKAGRNTLHDIRFVVYNQDIPTVQAFEAEMSRLQSGGTAQKVTRHRQLYKPQESYGSQEYQSAPAAQNMDRGRSTYGQGGISQLRMTDCTVTIVQGDITKESTDAIVNSTNKSLNFASQVSRAILQRGGHDILQECQSLGKVNDQNVAVTGAGNLPCQKIIHVAAPSDTSAFRYTSTWKTRVRHILETADQYGMGSIALPALGTGILNTDASKMAGAIFDAFYEFNKTKPITLKAIRVVVFEDYMLDTFVTELKKMGDKKKGVLETITDTFSSISGYFSGSGGAEDNDYSHRENTFAQKTPSEIHQSKMTFHIYGMNQGRIDQVVKRIDDFCDQESQDRILDSSQDQETIAKLGPSQVQYIKSLESKHHVRITIDRGARINRIRIQGQHAATTAVMEEIWKIFRAIDKEQREKSEAELISKQVQWQFDNNGYEAYPPEMNLLIEKAYQDKKNYAEWKEKERGVEKTHRVMFGSKMEIELGNPTADVKVRRYTQDSVEIPSNWVTMAPGDTVKLVTLAAGSQEFNDVQQQFTTSLQAKSATIKSIQRVQNPSMYKKYMVHKAQMDAANPAGTVNEKCLWHGTSADTIDEINTSGFNRSFCGKNGTAHGKGVYFATYASLSAGYAAVDANGNHSMYLCKVLVGESCQSNPSYIVPPAKNQAKPTIKYDSVVDNMTAPKIIVIFTDTQAYPEYLITYQ